MKKTLLILSVLVTFAVTSCAAPTLTPTPASPTATPVPPTTMPVPPTATPIPPSPTAVRAFATTDLARLVLQASEVPPPTENDPRFSAPIDLDSFMGSKARADQMRALGYQAGHLQGTKTVNPCNSVCSVFSWALLFKDANGAHQALDLLNKNSRTTYQNIQDIPLSDLSDDGYGIQGLLPATGLEVTVYVWRVNNVVLACHSNGKPGTVKASDVLAVAAKMHSHTK